MNKKEFKKVAKALVKKKFQYEPQSKIVEIDCFKSAVDKTWCIRYIVILNTIRYREVFISEDDYYGLFYKETLLDGKHEIETNFYSAFTLDLY